MGRFDPSFFFKAQDVHPVRRRFHVSYLQHGKKKSVISVHFLSRRRRERAASIRRPPRVGRATCWPYPCGVFLHARFSFAIPAKERKKKAVLSSFQLVSGYPPPPQGKAPNGTKLKRSLLLFLEQFRCRTQRFGVSFPGVPRGRHHPLPLLPYL